jgi:hypothetical protein
MERDLIRAAYDRTDYLEVRRKMMQIWVDSLDESQSGSGTIVSISAAGSAR